MNFTEFEFRPAQFGAPVSSGSRVRGCFDDRSPAWKVYPARL